MHLRALTLALLSFTALAACGDGISGSTPDDTATADATGDSDDTTLAGADDDSGAQLSQTIADVHASLASVIPSHLAIMFTMSWFGIPKSGDPAGAGKDSKWGNWQIPGDCSATGQPTQCVDGQRNVASLARPLTGIYSSSGRDEESRAHLRLMLSAARRPCADDVGARIDAFAVQLDGTKFTSMHSASPGESAEIPYQSLLHMYAEADTAGLENVVLPADDTAWYWNNGHYFGLECAKTPQACYDAVQQDVIDMLTLAVRHPSSLRLAGKPVLYFYITGALQPAQWSAIFAKARATVIDKATHDFYPIASKQGGGGSSYFAAFDGMSPWISLDDWQKTSGSTVRAHATAYAARQHKELYDNLPAGKVVLGGVQAGFDDFTNGWNKCGPRHLPDAPHARDPAFLDGAMDYLAGKHAKGIVLQTWDDWTEGSEFEPSVSEGTSKLVQLQTRLGDLYGEAAVSPKAIQDRWASYGQARGCGTQKAPPDIDLCEPVASSGCSAPSILEPTANQKVGPSIHLRTSAPACIDAVIAYVDGVRGPGITDTSDTSIDAWVNVGPGAHTLVVNGWSGATVYASPTVTFTGP